CARRSAVSGRAAAAVDRFRVAHWFCPDGSGRKPDRARRGAARACAQQAPSRDRVWIVLAGRGDALPGEPCLLSCRVGKGGSTASTTRKTYRAPCPRLTDLLCRSTIGKTAWARRTRGSTVQRVSANAFAHATIASWFKDKPAAPAGRRAPPSSRAG